MNCEGNPLISSREFYVRNVAAHYHGMNNLAYYRELRGLSQRDLAEMIGVSQPTIQRAEREDTSAKLGTYTACAKVLGVTLAQIFDDRSEIERIVAAKLRDVDPAKLEAMLLLAGAAPPAEPSAE